MGSSVAMAVLGIWFMAAPGIWGFGKTISDNNHIVGPLIVAFSIIAIWECTRNVRWLNIPLVAWLLVAPWVLQYHNPTALLNNYGVAILVLLLCLVKRKKENSFGGGWPAVWKSGSRHSRLAGNQHRIQVKR